MDAKNCYNFVMIMFFRKSVNMATNCKINSGLTPLFVSKHNTDCLQVVCHVTRFKSEKTARVVAAQLYDAFQRLYTDCQMALASSRLFAKMARQRDSSGGRENTEGFVFDEAD